MAELNKNVIILLIEHLYNTNNCSTIHFDPKNKSITFKNSKK